MGSTIKNLDEIKRFEVTEVYTHPDAKVDIVFIHGLNGNPRTTWRAKNGTFWPTDLLPASLKSAQARILVYGYNADVYTFGNGKSASSDMIHQHAQSLLSNLALERKSEEVSDHPIIFVVHSLGGILLKRALELSYDLSSKNAEDNRSIYVSTYGIIFLGTPHNGADAAKWGLILQGMVDALVPKKIMESEAQMVRTLQKNNETLQNINLHFLDIYQRFKICMVHEQVKTDLKGTKMLIVDQDSAGPMLPDVVYFGIEATHSEMCKFESKNSPGYLNVSTIIKTWVQECRPTIQARWDMERKTRRQIREAQAAELLDIYPPLSASNAQTSANTPDASSHNSTILIKPIASIEPAPPEKSDDNSEFFIKPPGFRPNSIFIGREAELAELHKLLFDKKRRADGTSAVLIQSLPGGGKTHLARQYVYDHKGDFPGGIFWLPAKSEAELTAGFWDIARKAALKSSLATQDDSGLKDPEQFIKLVRKWLKHRHDWLMVLDGIHFDDAEGLRKFIPDVPNTGLIYTSTEKSVSKDPHWMNPQIMKLPLLSAREAQRLLLLELDKKEPFMKDDLKYSMELVQSMGFLPVVIHAVAQRLKATDEPLGKFSRSFAAEPRLRALDAYTAVVDQLKVLGAYEALNLIYILCFFSSLIPVEMISLGVKVLDGSNIPVRACEPVTGCTLNSTFRILNMFALIDRSNHEASMHSSQSSKGSRDVLADNVDVLRLHSVVQGFFMDYLLAGGRLPMWLNIAVRVFCCSYDMANERITRKTNAGLVEDYRLYEIHGIRLQSHLSKHHKKAPELDETALMLAARLVLIKNEIERRTPQSSQFIANERPDAFQTSIFDRTSSSSDTGGETPFDDKLHSAGSTWGLEHDKLTLDSPISLMHRDIDFSRPLGKPREKFALPITGDPGYDSDRESTAMTLQPSQRTAVQPLGSVVSPDGAWETVKPRRPRARTGRLDHRTTRTMEKQRYRDSAGSFRFISKQTIDPRISQDTAQGFLDRPRSLPRGRLSGRSSAEVALTQITKTSPPPPRGGGLIRDRSSSVRGVGRRRLPAKTASYAAAAAGTTTEPVSRYEELARPAADFQESSNESNSGLSVQSPSSAIAALQKFPIEITRSLPTPDSPSTPNPPYPSYPSDTYPQPYPLSDTQIYEMPGRYSQENLSVGPDPYANVFPRKTGPIPYENLQSLSTSSFPRKRDLPHDYPVWHSQTYSEILPPHQTKTPMNLSLSSPNIRSSEGAYYPGRPELSGPTHQGGYTSQPMSRDPSGQSAHSNLSVHSETAVDRFRRSPSLAETEPMPQLPAFSPRVPPTSYQMYERMKDERDLSADRDRGLIRKSPRMEFARVSDRIDEWASGVREDDLPPRRRFNPTAPAFSPSPSFFPAHSPGLPSAPANSMVTNPSNATSSYPSPHQPTSTHYSPQPAPHTTPQSTQYSPQPRPASHSSPDSSIYPPQPPQTTPQSFVDDGEQFHAPEMGRTASGGMRVGRRMIEFGDFPEPVDFDFARERADRGRSEKEKERDSESFRGDQVEGLGIRGLRR